MSDSASPTPPAGGYPRPTPPGGYLPTGQAVGDYNIADADVCNEGEGLGGWQQC